ncbi:hypothetical protein L3Q72_03425 [Vibrio sp. JC009]|uniref:hypothetical protein n=1 Tax=Vibrio sp. JC009 TaxID=2912314 RepID=UPI0023AF9DC6|nr:hypothetical protein [Vibrio sp. JC009]WED22467.1 hypothetical protein L3Q72_03425 [Vibrio sp. JC009]
MLFSCISLAVSAATREEQIAIDLAIALNGAMEPEELVVLLMEQKPELAEDILSSLMKAHPDNSSTIAQAAIAAAPEEQVDALMFAAIGSGLDPTRVAEATAAGTPDNK